MNGHAHATLRKEHSAAAMEDGNFDAATDLAKERFAQGLLALLVPVVQDLDNSVLAVRESQIELFREIERLSGELQKFVEASKAPALDAYMQKLINARRRVQAINTTLKTVQERMDRVYHVANRRKPGA